MIQLNIGNYNKTINIVKDVTIGELSLPGDVVLAIDGSKQLAQSQILDGVAVFERITRKPFEISFDFTLRHIVEERERLTTIKKYVFPIDEIARLHKVWQQNSVQSVQNQFLNKLGIFEIVIESVKYNTVRGNTDVPVQIKAYENYNTKGTQANSLIIK